MGDTTTLIHHCSFVFYHGVFTTYSMITVVGSTLKENISAPIVYFGIFVQLGPACQLSSSLGPKQNTIFTVVSTHHPPQTF